MAGLKVIHIITGLNDGGAEGALFRLCKGDKKNYHQVVSLTGSGKYHSMLSALGVPVFVVHASYSWVFFISLCRVIKILRREKPDIVQTWMYHADLFGGLAARLAGVRALVWGIRHTNLDPTLTKRSTVVIARILARLSRSMPRKIVVCSRRAATAHEMIGYDQSRMQFIPNGYDLKEFRPGLVSRRQVASHMRLRANIPLIGMVGRFHPLKGHSNLLDALAILRERGVEFRCLLVGAGLNQANVELMSWVVERRLVAHVELLGPRRDIPQIMNQLDLHVLSSLSEGFPNVVAEAMACGTPCVVTDVGDAAYIVGNTGWVAAARNATDLADAIIAGLQDLNSAGWQLRCEQVRARIEAEFSIESMVERYNQLWIEVVKEPT
jgi:glycosyltransferase involved in cell wall biosynthesis